MNALLLTVLLMLSIMTIDMRRELQSCPAGGVVCTYMQYATVSRLAELQCRVLISHGIFDNCCRERLEMDKKSKQKVHKCI
jgi:hypothetical protein